MQHVFYLLLRRLRVPIITIICVYATSILGFVLIPGVDDEGNPWHMDFFHAFYFVSFMSTTIGFGELPYPFTPTQRLWTTFSIYGTVICWLYSIGTIFALFQEPNFRRAAGAHILCPARQQNPRTLLPGLRLWGDR